MDENKLSEVSEDRKILEENTLSGAARFTSPGTYGPMSLGVEEHRVGRKEFLSELVDLFREAGIGIASPGDNDGEDWELVRLSDGIRIGLDELWEVL